MANRRDRTQANQAFRPEETDLNDIDVTDGSISAFSFETVVAIWAQDQFLLWKKGKEEPEDEIDNSGSIYPSLSKELSLQNKNDLQEVDFEFFYDRTRFKTRTPRFHNGEVEGKPKISPQKVVISENRSKNNSNTMQESSIQVDAVTESIAEIELDAVIANPVDKTMEIELPPDVQHRAGFGNYLKVKTSSQTFRETLEWKAHSPVKIPAWHEAQVTMQITEKNYSSKFDITVNISGEVRVNCYRKADRQLLTTVVGGVGNIWEHAEGKMQAYGLSDGIEGEKIKDKKLKITTTGKAKFVYGVEKEESINITKIKRKGCHCCCVLM